MKTSSISSKGNLSMEFMSILKRNVIIDKTEICSVISEITRSSIDKRDNRSTTSLGFVQIIHSTEEYLDQNLNNSPLLDMEPLPMLETGKPKSCHKNSSGSGDNVNSDIDTCTKSD